MRQLLAAGAVLLTACQATPPEPARETPASAASPNSPSAQVQTWQLLKQDLEAVRHSSDGGGRAWLTEEITATASTPARFPIVFETGPEGIAVGGRLFLQPSSFWGWSTPQVQDPETPGFTRISTEAAGVELEALTVDANLLAITVRGRALVPGERVHIVYGDGPAGAVADRYAEQGSRLWLAVDGDGDGIRAVLEDSPRVTVLPGPPVRLVLTLPTVLRPGETGRLTMAVLDRLGNAGVDIEGEVRLEASATGLELPPAVTLEPRHHGHRAVEVRAAEEGIYRIAGSAPGGLTGRSNPVVVTASGPRVYWADLHGHSQVSDGSGTPEQYFAYARDVAALDIAVLTDHDHWGVRFLDQAPELWAEICEQVRRFHEPGRFVTLRGYEWTSWLHGHRHVLYFADEGEVLSSVEPDYETPDALWQALDGQRALTVAHHSAGGPVATNWQYRPPAHLEPVTEIVSVHGSSEAADSPSAIYSPVAGNFVRDQLDRGLRFGFIGSGDSHDGHPGFAHFGSHTGGVAAVIADELSREALWQALQQRRVYATSGQRILLRAALGGHPMGAEVPVAADGSDQAALFLSIVATAPVVQVDLVRSGLVQSNPVDHQPRELDLEWTVKQLLPGEYLYLRVTQEDGGLAWTSPFFLVADQTR